MPLFQLSPATISILINNLGPRQAFTMSLKFLIKFIKGGISKVREPGLAKTVDFSRKATKSSARDGRC